MTNSKYNWENESDKILKRLVSQDEEEFLSKRRARELFDNEILKNIQVGTFEGLKEIHRYLFQECYGSAGEVRKHDIWKLINPIGSSILNPKPKLYKRVFVGNRLLWINPY